MSALLTTGVEFPDSSVQTTAVQSGFIIEWYGNVGSIPPGWKVCDGTNGTPNLRDKFIAGAGLSYAVGSQGGLATVTLTTAQLPTHSHPVTLAGTDAQGSHTHPVSLSTVGNHTHPFSPSRGVRIGPGYTSQAGWSGATLNPIGSVPAHTHTSSNLPAGGDHTHTVSLSLANTSGGGNAHENRPPYFALLYLMKE